MKYTTKTLVMSPFTFTGVLTGNVKREVSGVRSFKPLNIVLKTINLLPQSARTINVLNLADSIYCKAAFQPQLRGNTVGHT